MGTIYCIINNTKKEAIHLNCKYGELVNFSKFLTWLFLEWNKEDYEFINDNNSQDWDKRLFEYKDSTESYRDEFKESFWFNNH